MDVMKSSLKEKVTRMAIATLRNLIQHSPDTNTLPMVGNKLYPLLQQFLTRKWTDDEIRDDLQFLESFLEQNIAQLR